MARGALAAGARARDASRAAASSPSSPSSPASLHVPCPTGSSLPRLALGAPRRAALRGAVPHGHAPGGARRAAAGAAAARSAGATSASPNADASRNPARELARKIGRTIPIIYGSGGLGGVAAMRWKHSVNENAKAPAFWNEYPELDHNEICGWGQHGDVTRQVFTLVELRHGLEHPRLERRAVATRELIDEAVNQVITVEAEGEGRLAQLLDLDLPRRLDELLPRARQRRRSRPHRRDHAAQGRDRLTDPPPLQSCAFFAVCEQDADLQPSRRRSEVGAAPGRGVRDEEAVGPPHRALGPSS